MFCMVSLILLARVFCFGGFGFFVHLFGFDCNWFIGLVCFVCLGFVEDLVFWVSLVGES